MSTAMVDERMNDLPYFLQPHTSIRRRTNSNCKTQEFNKSSSTASQPLKKHSSEELLSGATTPPSFGDYHSKNNLELIDDYSLLSDEDDNDSENGAMESDIQNETSQFMTPAASTFEPSTIQAATPSMYSAQSTKLDLSPINQVTPSLDDLDSPNLRSTFDELNAIPSPLTTSNLLEQTPRRKSSYLSTPHSTGKSNFNRVASPSPHNYSYIYKHTDHMQRFRHSRNQTNQFGNEISQFTRNIEDSRQIRNKFSLTNTSELQNVGQYVFDAVRLTKCDWFIKGWEKTATHTVRVWIDIYRKTISIAHEDITNISSENENRIVIPFDDITGLEFQHSPLSDDIVVIEVCKVPEISPPSMKSNFFFLYVSREDSAKYMDGALLSADKRLHKLAIVGLPTWATIVNRYSIPIFYNHRFRELVTTLVNIYIIISLIWGFYDLYKNLPIVGGALRALFGPVATFMEPLLRNKVMLLIPLVFTKALEATNSFLALFAPLIALFKPVGRLFSVLGSAFASFLRPLADMIYALGNGFIYPFIQLYNYVLYPTFNLLYLTIVGIAQFISLLGNGIFTTLKVPVNLLVTLFTMLYNFTFGIFEELAIAISYPITAVKILFTVIVGLFTLLYNTVVYPFTKLKALFTINKDIQKATEVVSNLSKASSNAVSSTSTIKDYLMSLKENFQPLSSLWNGIRRIIDSIIHTYHTKIKYRSVWKRRILITLISLLVLAGLIIVFALVF